MYRYLRHLYQSKLFRSTLCCQYNLTYCKCHYTFRKRNQEVFGLLSTLLDIHSKTGTYLRTNINRFSGTSRSLFFVLSRIELLTNVLESNQFPFTSFDNCISRFVNISIVKDWDIIHQYFFESNHLLECTTRTKWNLETGFSYIVIKLGISVSSSVYCFASIPI